MYTKPNLSSRTARPQTLASAFGGLMRIFGRTTSDADLANRWDEIMGADIAGVAHLAGITKLKDKKFNIILRAENPALALQLTYMVPDIMVRINKYFGYDAVNKIVIRK